MSLSDEIQRGIQAQSILDSEIYQESVEAVRSAIIRQWEACPIRDVEGQHELKLMLKLLGDIQANIKTVMETGKLASVQIERESKLKSLKRAVGF